MGLEDGQHVEQQIAEIARVEGREPGLVGGVEFLAAAGGEGLALGGVEHRRGQAAVLPAVDQPGELARGPALLVEVGGEDELLEQAQLVVGVEDGEVRLQADELGVAAQHARGDAVEGAEPRHALDRAAGNGGDALLHLARRLVGEGDGEDLARPGLAGGDEVGEARGQSGGLAGAGASQHQHRPLGRQHRLALRRVEAGDDKQARGRRGEAGQGIRASNRRRSGGTEGQPPRLRCYARYPRYPQASSIYFPLGATRREVHKEWVIGTEVPASPERRQRQEGRGRGRRSDLHRQAMRRSFGFEFGPAGRGAGRASLSCANAASLGTQATRKGIGPRRAAEARGTRLRIGIDARKRRLSW